MSLELSIAAPIIIALLTLFFTLKRERTYLKPVSVKLDQSSDEWAITVKNFGTNLAKTVKVSSVCFQSFKKLNTRLVCAEGPVEIGQGESKEYRFDKFLAFQTPLQIKWSTLTGHNQSSTWSISISGSPDKDDCITQVPILSLYIYRLFRLFHNFRNKTRKEHRFDEYPILKL